MNLAVAFFFGAVLLYLVSCNFASIPSYDVPPCSSVSSCAKATVLHENANWYAQLVGRSWYYSNAAVKLYDSAREFCSGDVNIEVIPDLVASATAKLARPAQQAVYYADQSVSRLIQRIALIDNEFHRSGVQYTPYDDLRQYYSTTSTILGDLNSGVGHTRLSDTLLTYRSMSVSVRKLLLSAETQMDSIVRISSHAVNLVWPTIPPGFSSLIVVGIDQILQSKYGGHDLINASVGLQSSVFSAARPFLNGYYDVLERYDRKAADLLEEAQDVRSDVYELSVRIESRGIPEFAPEMLSLLPNIALREAIIAQLPEKVSSDARIRADTLTRSIAANIGLYRMREHNYFLALYRAEQNYEELQRLKTDLEAYIEDYESLAKSCYSIVSKYRPHSSYVSSVLPGYAVALKSDPDLYTCADALWLIVLDKNYASDESILASCERDISCGEKKLPEDYPCVVGDLRDRISCCRSYRERKIVELKSTDMYAQYMSMREAIEALLSYYDDPGLHSDYLKLPVMFICESDLADTLSRATKIYLQLRKRASEHIFPIMDVDGYIDAKTVSTVRIRFLLDAGNADILVDYALPFQILAYRNLRSDGLWVAVSNDGKTVTLRGSGWVEIEAQLMPVSLETEELGSYNGYLHLRVVNPYALPVRYPVSGTLLSGSSNVHFDGTYVYFDGVGEAIVALRLLELNYTRVGDTVYVSVRNTGEQRYSGDVVVPYSGTELPKNCKSIGKVTVCSLRLNPFSEESFEIGGVVSEANTSFAPVSVVDSVTEFSRVVESPVVVSVSAENNAVNSLRERVLNLLSELRVYYDRAAELNVTYLLPFSERVIDDLQSQVEDANDILALSSIYTVAFDARSSLVSKAKALVFSIPESEDVRGLAERALVNGDYVLALALAAAYDPEEVVTGSSAPYLATFLGLVSLAALVYYLRDKKPKKRKKLPKI